MKAVLSHAICVCFALFVVFAPAVHATTFIVPSDEELIEKSDGIITGHVRASRVIQTQTGHLLTVYEIAIETTLKGPFAKHETVSVTSPGGYSETRYTHVASSAHFEVGDYVLLFLTSHQGGWAPTDMILGKFRPGLTSRGYSVLVRDDEDIVGWDRDGRVHREKIRLEAEFLHFIHETVAGRSSWIDYEIEAGDALATPPTTDPFPVTSHALKPATTYSISFWGCSSGNLTRYPGRRTTAAMTSGISYRKNATQNASNLGDGGVSVIQNGLASWTNDCSSAVNINYAGTTPNVKNGNDGVNVILFNDPNGDIPGSWTGAGVIATAFQSGGNLHTFEGTSWVELTDTDIVFQDGFPGDHPAMNVAMTHEIGHTIGLRHADKSVTSCTATIHCVLTCSEPACDAGTHECSNSAVMTAVANSAHGFTLQTWDSNAANALYPATCNSAPSAPTNVLATATSGSNVNVTWTAAGGATSYNVYRSANGVAYDLRGNTATTSFNDAASSGTAYLYKVRATNGTESSDSNVDLATTVIFTDPTITAGTTPIKAAHVTELRTAVNAVRVLAGLGATAFTDASLAGVSTKALHMTELRTAITVARAALALPAPSFTDATLTAGVTPIKKAHIDDLRNGVK
jgi:hypothetical protein